LIVDSLGVYQLKDFKPTYVLLTNSPTINLERLINTLHPELIIADASNYKSYVRLWQKTCKNHNIKFHYTVTNGAFVERFYK
jgi:competence protein ComEC